MKNTLSYIVACPHCGATKRVAFSPTPWSNKKAPLWSDGHVEYVEWCEPSWTQQCPLCNHFFILPAKSSLKVENVPYDDTGTLSYQTLKQAVIELSEDEKSESRARLDTWWAYNNLYKDSADDAIPIKEIEFNRHNMKWLLEYLLKQKIQYYSLVFELYRLLGNKKEYNALLDSFTFEKYQLWRQARYKQRGVEYVMNDEMDKCSYDNFIQDKHDALDKPLRPYKKL